LKKRHSQGRFDKAAHQWIRTKASKLAANGCASDNDDGHDDEDDDGDDNDNDDND